MEKLGFLNLSDEILVHIFSYLDATDKLNAFRTCVRFSSVLCDWKLSRKLKLIGNYSVTAKDIKCYLKPKLMRQNIRMLDLTNCYWILPSEIYNNVLNFKSLDALFLIDIPFTFKQIVKIVNGLTKLKYLSFTWPQVSKIEISDDGLNSLEFLYIFIPKIATANWLHIFSWICKCKNLKQLYLICAPGDNCPTQIQTVLGQNLHSQLALHTLVIVGLENEYLLQTLKSICRIAAETCKCLWLPTASGAWNEYFAKNEDGSYLNLNTSCLENLAQKNHRVTFGQKGKIERLYCSSFEPPVKDMEKYESLKQLETKCCFDFPLLQSLCMLTVLCVPACCFSDLRKPMEQASLLPKWCPEIQDLELHYMCERCISNSRKNEFLLEIIPGWPKLKTLKLSDFQNLRSGKAFDKIFKSCKNLEKLFLRDLGALCGYVFEFTKALKRCKNLKHFRFEETVTFGQMTCLFDALVECPLIERVALVFWNTSGLPTEELVLNLIEKSPKLIFLCIAAPSMLDVRRKKLIKIITDRFTPARPALRCCFNKFQKLIESPEKEKLPAIHFYEMLCPDISGPFELPHRKDFFFEVPDLDVAAIESTL